MSIKREWEQQNINCSEKKKTASKKREIYRADRREKSSTKRGPIWNSLNLRKYKKNNVKLRMDELEWEVLKKLWKMKNLRKQKKIDLENW